MNNDSKEIFGSVMVAVGTISAAIGASPLNFIKSNVREDLSLWGNVLQAGGNALQADVQSDILSTIGQEFQAIGNATVITGLVIDFKEKTAQKLFITGNWVQALGALINVGHGIELNPSPGHSEKIIGNLLLSIGNSLQAIGWVYKLEKNGNTDKVYKEHNNGISLHSMGGVDEYGKRYENYIEDNNGESLVVTGSWIQAIGSIILVIGTIK